MLNSTLWIVEAAKFDAKALKRTNKQLFLVPIGRLLRNSKTCCPFDKAQLPLLKQNPAGWQSLPAECYVPLGRQNFLVI